MVKKTSPKSTHNNQKINKRNLNFYGYELKLLQSKVVRFLLTVTLINFIRNQKLNFRKILIKILYRSLIKKYIKDSYIKTKYNSSLLEWWMNPIRVMDELSFLFLIGFRFLYLLILDVEIVLKMIKVPTMFEQKIDYFSLSESTMGRGTLSFELSYMQHDFNIHKI